MPAYIGWPRGGVPRGSEWHYKKFFSIVSPRGGGPTLLFTLDSESVVRIEKSVKMTKFLFLAQGHVWVKKKVWAKLKSTSRRGGGGKPYTVPELALIVLLIINNFI